MSDSSVPPEPDLESFLGDIETNGSSIEDPDLGRIDFGPPETGDTTGFEDATVTIGDGACVVCGAPTFRPPGLTKTGRRKRTPKYCDLHTQQPRRNIADEPASQARLENQLQRVQEELADDLRLLGTLAGPLFPVTGYYIFLRSDAFTVAVLKLCKNNQRALRVLHRAASIAPVYEVARDVAGAAYSMQVDMEKADPHSMASQRLGVEMAYSAVYPENTNNTSTNGFQGPPRYATVS